MERYRYYPSTQDGWKSYPIRLTTHDVSRCHNKPRILVQSMEGGFVTANCVACGQKDTLTMGEFRKLTVYAACPKCHETMDAGFVPDSSEKERNYGFRCEACGVYIWLADLLPHWEKAL